MLFIESDPWPRLTLIVSLEAIFLSTFVMIGQNRQAEFQRAKADHDFATEAQELRTNTELTRAVYTLTTELHRHVLGGASEEESLVERPDDYNPRQDTSSGQERVDVFTFPTELHLRPAD